MADHLTAEDAARLLDEARAAWAQANRLEFTVDRLEGERDAALAEVSRLREALTGDVRLLDLIVKALEPYDIPTGSWSAAEKVEPAKAVLAALAGGSDVLPTQRGAE